MFRATLVLLLALAVAATLPAATSEGAATNCKGRKFWSRDMRTSSGTAIATFELYWIPRRKWACGIIRRRGTRGSKYAYMYVGLARCYTGNPKQKCVFEGGPDPSVSQTTERTSARRSPPLTIKTGGNCIWAGAMIAIYDPDRSASTATGRTDGKGRFCNL